jgi:anti-sigma regulatory factor (Ser/Thr protein kinase)
VELEGLWNELSETAAFALLCAYPTRLFEDPGSAEQFAAVCQHHDRVIQGAPQPPWVKISRRFPPAAASSRLARQFVVDTLRGWGCEAVIDDAALVVAELAANAILHARSDLSVGLARSPGVVRVVVGDTSEAAPVPRVVDVHSPSGRGLHLIAALAHDWGHDVVAGGKLVWVDLPVPEALSLGAEA